MLSNGELRQLGERRYGDAHNPAMLGNASVKLMQLSRRLGVEETTHDDGLKVVQHYTDEVLGELLLTLSMFAAMRGTDVPGVVQKAGEELDRHMAQEIAAKHRQEERLEEERQSPWVAIIRLLHRLNAPMLPGLTPAESALVFVAKAATDESNKNTAPKQTVRPEDEATRADCSTLEESNHHTKIMLERDLCNTILEALRSKNMATHGWGFVANQLAEAMGLESPNEVVG